MPKIEVVKQRDLKDCGACCMECLLKYFGGYVPLEKIRDDTCTGVNGTTAFHIIKALCSYGFDAMGVKASALQDENIYLPAIAHVVLKNGLQHFVVVYKITAKMVYLMDPAKGKVKMTIEEFAEIWDNILILATPSGNILRYTKEMSVISLFGKLLLKNKYLFLKILAVNFLLMIMTIIGSFYFQISISSIEAQQDTTFIKFIVILFFIVFLIKVVMNYTKTYYLNYLNKNLDTELFSLFLEHIFKLPLKFIQNRSTGEIVTRIDELSDTKNLFSEIFSTFILNMILIIGAIVTLFMINSQLFFLLCLIITIYIIVGAIFSKGIYHKIKENIEATTDFNTTLIENVDMNFSIKNLNLVREFIYRIENKLILMLKSNFSFINVLNIIEFLKNFIYEIGLFAITTLGLYLIYQGKLEVLSLVTFNSIILYLFNPAKELVDLIPKYNYLKASFNKLSEFLASEIEKDHGGFMSLKNGSINVKDLTYSYDLFNKILDKVSFQVESSDKVLLSGPSGSGKSTICKLLYRSLGSYSGNIEFNNTSECDYSLKAIRENILYVGQNEKLFTGTIRENIECFRPVAEESFKDVCKICRLDSIVSGRPNRFNTVINASLNNLSGGEKQRIILARALLKKAKIIILDEALSEVNVTMEKEILDDIFVYFKDCTLIYVTHKNVDDKFEHIIRLEASC